jgi:TetR/AcrR family transcriptional regulator, copper-responsive repressor
VRKLLAETFAAFDRLFEQRLRSAQRAGELARAADVSALSHLATAVLHTLALRARAGESRRALERIAVAGVDAICGPGPAAKRAARPSEGR